MAEFAGIALYKVLSQKPVGNKALNLFEFMEKYISNRN
jgi:hypothetical protein